MAVASLVSGRSKLNSLMSEGRLRLLIGPAVPAAFQRTEIELMGGMRLPGLQTLAELNAFQALHAIDPASTPKASESKNSGGWLDSWGMLSVGILTQRHCLDWDMGSKGTTALLTAARRAGLTPRNLSDILNPLLNGWHLNPECYRHYNWPGLLPSEHPWTDRIYQRDTAKCKKDNLKALIVFLRSARKQAKPEEICSVVLDIAKQSGPYASCNGLKKSFLEAWNEYKARNLKQPI